MKIKPKPKKNIRRKGLRASEKHTHFGNQKSNILASETLDKRFSLAPFVLRLTEDENGVHVPKRIQLFRTGTFKKLMPDGKTISFSITKRHLEEMVENFVNKVRGTDIAVDFAHKSDEEAAAWFTDLQIEESSKETQLWADVEWTPDGHAAVGGKKFRYLSPDFVFGWTDNETGKKYGATLFGAGLTNRPVIKHMAPTVELTEVTKMAKKVTKKVSELNVEELTLLLASEKDEEKKELIQLRLDEMSEDDGDDEDEEDDDAAPGKKKPKADKEMNMEELKAAYEKVCEEVSTMKKSMAASLAETQKKEKEAKFTLLLAEGKAVPAQKEAFMSDDTVKFAELSEKPKFTTIGGHGANTVTKKEDAADEVLKLAEEAVKTGKASKTESISYVLKNNPELNARHTKEMEEVSVEVE